MKQWVRYSFSLWWVAYMNVQLTFNTLLGVGRTVGEYSLFGDGQWLDIILLERYPTQVSYVPMHLLAIMSYESIVYLWLIMFYFALFVTKSIAIIGFYLYIFLDGRHNLNMTYLCCQHILIINCYSVKKTNTETGLTSNVSELCFLSNLTKMYVNCICRRLIP